ncbi:MAG: hypothetical protein OXI56_08615 [bacterium]|nr:hypothetical protein [bacterium]MDE0601841.1 hypothetical protein [bacterium]
MSSRSESTSIRTLASKSSGDRTVITGSSSNSNPLMPSVTSTASQTWAEISGPSPSITGKSGSGTVTVVVVEGAASVVGGASVVVTGAVVVVVGGASVVVPGAVGAVVAGAAAALVAVESEAPPQAAATRATATIADAKSDRTRRVGRDRPGRITVPQPPGPGRVSGLRQRLQTAEVSLARAYL